MSRSRTLLALILLALPSLAAAEDAWLQTDIQALRWPDAQNISARLQEGDQVVVIYRTEDLVRIRKGSDFGWVPPSALSDQDPEAEPLEEALEPDAEAPDAEAPEAEAPEAEAAD